MRAESESSGFDQAIARVVRLQGSMPRRAGLGVYAAGVAIFTASQAEVPKRTGSLMSSGRVGPLTDDGDGTYSVAIGYYGLRYTRIVHYNEHLAHVSGKAYFLIDPKRRFHDLVADNAAAAVKADIAL